jgi:hypothetical protein
MEIIFGFSVFLTSWAEYYVVKNKAEIGRKMVWDAAR